MGCESTFPHEQGAFIALLHLGAVLTVAYIADLMDPMALHRMILERLGDVPGAMPPDRLAKSGCFPAPVLRTVSEGIELQQGLLAGRAAIHVAGFPAVLLAGSSTTTPAPVSRFGPDLAGSVALLRLQLRDPGLRARIIPGVRGGALPSHTWRTGPARACLKR